MKDWKHWGNRWIKRTLLTGMVVLLLALISGAGGCESLTPEQMDQFRGQIAEQVSIARETAATTTAAIDQAKEQLAVMVTQLEATPDGPQRIELAETIERTESFIEKASKVNAEATSFLDNAEVALAKFDPNDPGTAITAGSELAAQHVPAPWNLAVTLGGLVIGSIITGIWKQQQQNKLKSAAASVVKAIDTVRFENGGVVNFDEQAVELRTLMTEDARNLVQEVKSNGPVAVKLKPLTT